MKSKMHKAFLAQQKYTDEEAVEIMAAKSHQARKRYEEALARLGLDKEPELEKPQQMEITDARPPDEMKGEIGLDWDGLAGKLEL